MNKLRHSAYLCTPSGNRKQSKSFVFAQFVHSTYFFQAPKFLLLFIERTVSVACAEICAFTFLVCLSWQFHHPVLIYHF